MACTSVLRIGPSSGNASAAILRNALIAQFETPKVDTSSSEESNSVLTVTNRYFSASVLLEDLGTNRSGWKEDGVILVFDALQSNPDMEQTSSCSFDSLTHVHELAETEGECGELLRLCVGAFMGEMTAQELRGKKHEEEYSRRVLWCLDRGYEYVEADLSLEGLKAGHDEREKDGFARIVEAVKGTMWSSAIRKTLENTKPGAVGSLLSQIESSDDTQPNQQVEQGKKRTNEASALREDDSAIENSSDGDANVTVDNKENGDSEELEGRRKEQEQEAAFDDLERVMGEAKKIREASLGGMMSDDDRRKRAGDAAILVMDLMDKLNFDDDTDDDSCSKSSEEQEERDAK